MIYRKVVKSDVFKFQIPCHKAKYQPTADIPKSFEMVTVCLASHRAGGTIQSQRFTISEVLILLMEQYVLQPFSCLVYPPS